MMMNTTKKAALRKKTTALRELKRKYLKPGDPLYLAGIQRIRDHYKKRLSIDEIKNFLAKSKSYTIHYEFKPTVHNPYYIRRLREMIQIDLIEITKISEANNGYRYILVAIDCFSRKVWGRLLMTKTADEVLSSLQSILKETGRIESICSDRGSEFTNSKMKTFLSDNGIKLIHPYTSTHAHFVERVQATLQSIIYKHITSKNNLKFYDKFQDFVKTYNRRKHRMTKLSPNEGEKKKNSLHIQEIQEDYRGKIEPTKKVKFKVGDQVRIAIAQGKFSRGYDQKSNEEIYKVVKVSKKLPRVLYFLATLDGEDVEGKFYQTQLTKVLEQDDFLIEEFLDENDTHYYIKFQGYNEPEWIPKENITNTIKDIMN
jgi:transposase InsO family protein